MKELIKHVATINDEVLSETTEPETEIKYVDIGNVDSNGRINEFTAYKFEDAPSRARRIVRDGDVIISTVRTYLQAIAAIESPPANLVVSTGFAVVRPRKDLLNVRFCKYALREPEFLHEVQARSVGVSYPAINASELGNISISVPSLAEQELLAQYLDRQTAKIDTLIAAKQKFLTLLAEKRSALITHAVTRGLNPNASLRDSGIEWLGKIPAHWDIEFARWLFQEIDERSETGIEDLLTVSHITGVTLRSEKNVNMFMAESMEGYKLCDSGDLVINTLWAWMSAMGVTFRPGIVSPSYNVYRPKGKYDPKFLDYLVRISVFAEEVTRYSKGVWSSRLRLYPEDFFGVVLPVPPLEEQQQISSYLAEEDRKLKELHNATRRTIDLLKERRTALISSTVTGKISVLG